MIEDFVNELGEFVIGFNKFTGSGWDTAVESIMRNKLNPIQIDKRIIEQTWDYSEKEFDVVKDDLKFIFHLDDLGGNYLLLSENVNDDSKQKLRDWATIIAEEVEKLKK